MTSRSLRNRRITAWSMATATSALLLLGVQGLAQTTGPGLDQPAPTTWSQYKPPAAPPPVMPPPLTGSQLPPIPTSLPGTKTVAFQKPAHDGKPIPLPVVAPQEAAPLPTPPAAAQPVVPIPRPSNSIAPMPEVKPRDLVQPRVPAATLPVPALDAPPVAPREFVVPQKTRPRELVTPAGSATPVRPAVMRRQNALPQPVPTQAPASQPAQPTPPMPTPPVAAEPQPAAPTTQPPAAASMPDPSRSPTDPTLPTYGELFRLDSDSALNARILKDLAERSKSVEMKLTMQDFPPQGSLVPPGTTYQPKTASYSPMQLLREPNYVIHRRLYFEEMNSERAGWDAGVAQAAFSSLYFYRDVLLFPAKIGSGIHNRYDASSGKCMPGDPTPYYYYPPDITTFGGVVGATVITGAAVIFP